MDPICYGSARQVRNFYLKVLGLGFTVEGLEFRTAKDHNSNATAGQGRTSDPRVQSLGFRV
jgi:hypothetical protein